MGAPLKFLPPQKKKLFCRDQLFHVLSGHVRSDVRDPLERELHFSFRSTSKPVPVTNSVMVVWSWACGFWACLSFPFFIALATQIKKLGQT